KPPARLPIYSKSIYLANSINISSTTDWQAKVTSSLLYLPITFFNPRRNNWYKD
ncbi:uncharacterized protein K441DRAFT_553967, partial [Cenococcum geophilum 1.58]|uniref:uncharacterized protein n=1 Tax=Cenococcum geophilum 1.58 TaxID=794803 RepID=UPI00358FB8CE